MSDAPAEFAVPDVPGPGLPARAPYDPPPAGDAPAAAARAAVRQILAAPADAPDLAAAEGLLGGTPAEGAAVAVAAAEAISWLLEERDRRHPLDPGERRASRDLSKSAADWAQGAARANLMAVALDGAEPLPPDRMAAEIAAGVTERLGGPDAAGQTAAINDWDAANFLRPINTLAELLGGAILDHGDPGDARRDALGPAGWAAVVACAAGPAFGESGELRAGGDIGVASAGRQVDLEPLLWALADVPDRTPALTAACAALADRARAMRDETVSQEELDACDELNALGDGNETAKLWDLWAEWAEAAGNTDGPPVRGGEVWSDLLRADLNAADDRTRAAWLALLAHCRTATGKGNKPPKAWLNTAAALLRDFPDPGAFRGAVAGWFPAVNRGRSRPLRVGHGGRHINKAVLPPHRPVLVGLAWASGLVEDEEVAAALGGLAKAADVKVPRLGRRVKELAAACVWALQHMPGRSGALPLAVLCGTSRGKTGQKSIRNAAERARDAVFERERLTPAETAEILERAG